MGDEALTSEDVKRENVKREDVLLEDAEAWSATDWLRRNWELVAWALLIVLAFVTRFYDLGVRAMSHDESLHALYSYYLYDAGNYEHNPMMHGPLLFHLNAFFYTLFGATDATARFGPALTGVGVVGMTYFFRRYIGRTGALMAGLLITISPSLLFHSRYIRNDIYIALFLLIWIYGAFRYLDTRRLRWATLMVAGMALGFITKENQFMNGAILGAFFLGLATWQVMDRALLGVAAPLIFAGGLSYYFREIGNSRYALIAIGVGALVALILFLWYVRGKPWRALRHNDAADLAVLMLTLVLPFTAPFGHLVLGWDAMAYATNTDLMRSVLLVGVMTALSAGIAFFWFGLRRKEEENEFRGGSFTFGDWAKMMGFFWIIQILFFTTFFTNIRSGLATGIVGSLGYWLAQQEVARGGQPWYYYLMLGSLYEFLPMILSGLGMVVVAWQLWRDQNWDPVAAGDLPWEIETIGAREKDLTQSRNVAEERREGEKGKEVGETDGVEENEGIEEIEGLGERLRRNRVIFAVFSVWWIVAAWGAYTIAGEKMPWLMTHMALPMTILGGWWLGRVLRRIDWRRAGSSGAVWLIGAAPAALFLLTILLRSQPTLGRTLSALTGVTQWLLALVLLAGLGYLIWRWIRAVGGWMGARLLGLGLVALLFLLTIRFTYMLTYVNYDLATEYLVYAHATPDVKRMLSELDEISERTVGDRNVFVTYDDDTSWPLSWYMRDYPNSRFYGAAPNAEVMSAPVIIVGAANYDKVHPYVVRDYVKRPYRLVWWPDQSYYNMTWQRIRETLTDPQKRKNLWEIVFYRRYPSDENPGQYRDLTKWPNRHEFEMWVRRDLANEIWDLNVAPLAGSPADTAAQLQASEIDLTASAIYNGVYDGLPLNAPRTLTVGEDGTRYIADSGNNRIVVLAENGDFVRAFGGQCNLAEGEASGCVDPDGDGPHELGDGQFFEPWGVAVDMARNIYVADTWNGRIQVFDADGKFLRKWGFFNVISEMPGDPNALFGPRGVAIDLDGNLLVADTGNKRILKYSPDGALIQQVGGGGVIGGRFEEPTDVTVDPTDGSVFVADAWNRRIQKLTPDLEFVEEWPVPSWESQDRFHKPYLAVDAGGRVFATDPAMYRVFVFDRGGTITATFGAYGVDSDRFALPNGVAVDLRTGEVLVADADNMRVMVFPGP
jgi:predicted membrane-bound mannosyltransferase/DNA-binding beta-propeller fold protein YncE